MRWTLLAALLISIAAFQAGTVSLLAEPGTTQLSGRIWSPYGQTPCDLCTLSLESGGIRIASTFTDGAGTFTFNNVRPGSYVIRGTVDGFNDIEVRVDVNSAGALSPLTIILEPKASVPTPSTGPPVVDVSSLMDRYPKKAVDLYKKAGKCEEKGNAGEAITELEEAIRIAPDFYQAHDDLGKLYKSARRLDDAEHEFVAARDLNRSNAEPLIQLTALYIDRNEPDRAVTTGEEAIQKDSRSASAFFNLGLALYRVSRLDRARDVLKRALVLAPTAPQIHLLLVNVYTRLHDWDNARAELDSYLQQNPNGSDRALAEEMRRQLVEARQQNN
jgi:tetratricopeptide (TPR) repeat protein